MARIAGFGAWSCVALLALAACDKPGPLASSRRPPPPPPAWGAPLQGRPVADAFPRKADCIGWVDETPEHFDGARKVTGWAWNRTDTSAMPRVVAVDAGGRMIGFGEGGGRRPDVRAANPEVRIGKTGWTLIAPYAQGASVWAINPATRTACRVGPLAG
jgi:hypothetical protein